MTDLGTWNPGSDGSPREESEEENRQLPAFSKMNLAPLGGGDDKPGA
jgi:hypothetical protein